MTKPDGTTHREFWVYRQPKELQNRIDWAENETCLYVIEKGAYQAAIAESDKWRKLCEEMREGHAEIVRNSTDILAKKNSSYYIEKYLAMLGDKHEGE